MNRLLSSRFIVPLLAILLIGFGILFLTRFARGSMDSYQAMRFAEANDFDAGNVDVEIIQPWMHLRYIAEAYAVPQSYLHEQLGIPGDRQSRRLPIGRINQRLRLGEVNDEPAIVEKVKEAIRSYRANPVVTGLTEGEVQKWMNVQYIANSTGIPAETFFDAADIPLAGNDYKPLGWLVDSIGYEPGEEHLLRTLQEVVEEHSKLDEDKKPDRDKDANDDNDEEKGR